MSSVLLQKGRNVLGMCHSAELSLGSLQQARMEQISGIPVPVPKTSIGRGCPGWTSPLGMSCGRALGLTVLAAPPTLGLAAGGQRD